MFFYFPNNYVWNLSVNIAMIMGAEIGEIDEMCKPLVEISTRGDDEGTQAFLAAWNAMADKLVAQADEDMRLNRRFSAARKHKRASIYYMIAERMQAHGFAPRLQTYRKMLDSFSKFVELNGENCQRVEIPYDGGVISGYLTLAPATADGPAPILVHVNGLDSCKEMLYLPGAPEGLARRGVSSLCIDQPGTGEALRLHDMKAVYNSERWASKVVDWLEARDDVDPSRIGLWGISLGGYYCPRAVAMEPRFALGVVFGANHNWAEVQEKRLRREGDRPVPHYWEHVRWVFGGETIDEFMSIASNMHLNGILDRVRVPFLVTHGINDRQISLDYAHQTYDQLVNSPKKELKIFDRETGCIEHAGADTQTYGTDYINDWVAETFAEIKAGRYPR
ncbi:alpha/beta hydrolase family protein [Rhizobium alvei]|uniref:Prolyl oligopeptidase family serine peptidase n=1 Tax=Rhizobium alvei TaxID=1132659 RepID=A0ABT8YNU7_9HYPH|nr:prolyl oligopeptidase family serine peptidase [Rhizobium alvei]MDO6965327.1 prolyl oligopeptidase family serine peptidase [Rhizobium alvei]